MIHLIFCNVVRKFGSRTKNMNRHWFVASPTKDGFSLPLRPCLHYDEKRIWRLQNFEIVITNFFVFAILFASETNEIFV